MSSNNPNGIAYTAEEARALGIGTAEPRGLNPAEIRNMALNATLQRIDQGLQSDVNSPVTQMAVLMLAQALAFRRLLEKERVIGRGQRMKLIAMATKDFETKLRRHALETPTPSR